MVGIYKITSPTNRVYVGQSTDIDKRFNKYKRLDCVGQVILYRSIKKHGIKNHKFNILELCDISELNKKERHWQVRYNCIGNFGLNCFIIKGDARSGILSKEYRDKLSESAKGKTRSKEYRKNISIAKLGEKNPMFGIPSHSRKIVLDTCFGIFYNSLKDAHKYYNISYKDLSRKLNGTRKNNTKLIYA